MLIFSYHFAIAQKKGMTISYDFLSTTVEGNPQSTPPPRHLHQIIARRAKGHQWHGGGVLWFQRWRLWWNCEKRRPSNKNHFQPFSHLPKKTLCSPDFSSFFLVKCWIFLGTFREFICSPDCFDLVFDAQVPLTIINGLAFWWAVSVAMLLLTLGCSVSDKWR